MTEAGLNTINLSQLNTCQQIVLFVLIVVGSAIWVSIATVHIRKRAFEQKLQELADKRKKKLPLSRSFHVSFSKTRRNSSGQREAAIASGAIRGSAIINGNGSSKDDTSLDPNEHITFCPTDEQEPADEYVGLDEPKDASHSTAQPISSPLSPDGNLSRHLTTGSGNGRNDPSSPGDFSSTLPGKVQILEYPHPKSLDRDLNSSTTFRRSHTRIFSGGGVGARLGLNNHPRNAPPHVHQTRSIDEEEKASRRTGESFGILDKYLKGFNGLVGRNSQFHGLSEKERRKLGGLEYDALSLLSYLVPVYFLLFQLAGAIGMGAWMQINRPGLALENGLNPFWTGSFFAIVSGLWNHSTAVSNEF